MEYYHLEVAASQFGLIVQVTMLSMVFGYLINECRIGRNTLYNRIVDLERKIEKYECEEDEDSDDGGDDDYVEDDDDE